MAPILLSARLLIMGLKNNNKQHRKSLAVINPDKVAMHESVVVLVDRFNVTTVGRVSTVAQIGFAV